MAIDQCPVTGANVIVLKLVDALSGKLAVVHADAFLFKHSL